MPRAPRARGIFHAPWLGPDRPKPELPEPRTAKEHPMSAIAVKDTAAPIDPDAQSAHTPTTTGVPDTAAKPGADEHIAGLRRRLDEIDRQIIELWQERAAISHEVGVTRVAAGGTRLVLA